LDYRATFSSGFLAIGERLSYYNSDGSSLEAGERDILYGMAEFAWRWHRNHWAGLRALHEDDHSGRAARLGANGRPEDDSDFQGWRFGLFSHGNLIDAPVSDYRLEAQYLDGTLLSLPPAGAGAGAAPIAMKSTRSGWAVVAELGRRLPSLPWSPRLSLRSGLTDAPETANNGFYFNRLQSGRVSGQDSYSSGLLGSFVRIELHNVMFHGLAVETQPRPQHRFDLRLSTLSLRNSGAMNGQRTALPLSVSRDVRLDKARGRTLGQVLDLTYHWELFPVAVNGRHLNLDVQLNAGYFHAGDALGDLDDDYQLSFSAAAHY
ncbi:MAG TPA: alginate export family protein, partial [Pseudomonas sp.]|nr:alginate export family protein [Pseudomonas sp.]